MASNLKEKNRVVYDLIKMNRASMGAANRKRSANAKLPVWLYPFAIENDYFKNISNILKEFISYVNAYLTKARLAIWVSEYKKDTIDTQRQDAFTTDSPTFLDILRNKVTKKFKEVISYVNAYLTKARLATWIDKTDMAGLERQDAFTTDFLTFLNILRNKVTKKFKDDPAPTRLLISNAAFKISSFNNFQFSKIMKRIMGVEYITEEPWERDVITVWGNNNFNLITSLTDEYIKKVNNIVSDGVLHGRSAEDIRRELIATNKNMSEYRSKLIARDQVGKLNGQFTQRRMQDAGLNLYEWLTALDERVREDHKKMQGKICRWDNANVYSTDGLKWESRPGKMQGAIPGSQIQCRCVGVPYMKEIYTEIDDEL